MVSVYMLGKKQTYIHTIKTRGRILRYHWISREIITIYIYHCLRKHCYQVNFSFTNAIMTIYLLSTNNRCSGLSMINYTLKSRNDFIGMSFLMNVFWFSVRKVEYVSDHFFCDQEFDNL